MPGPSRRSAPAEIGTGRSAISTETTGIQRTWGLDVHRGYGDFGDHYRSG